MLPTSQLCVIWQNWDGLHSLSALGWVRTSAGSTGCVPGKNAEEAGTVCFPWGAGKLGRQAAFRPPANRGTSFPGRRLAGGRGAGRAGDERGGFPAQGSCSRSRSRSRPAAAPVPGSSAPRPSGLAGGGAGRREEPAAEEPCGLPGVAGGCRGVGRSVRTSPTLPGAEARPWP